LDGVGVFILPMEWSTNDTAPEQSYAVSEKFWWPPPYRYGLPTNSFPASIATLTTCGAAGGATAYPFSSVAVRPGM
jgi:hypothetical protein